jgi:5-methylcytosine-specific restriction endonuclease McrA
MPSSNGYVRDYKREWANAKKRGEGKDNADRHRLRYAATKLGMVKPKDGKDIDHIKPLSKGGANTIKNARVTTKSANRSFPRNKDGSMKSNT